jgi:hypothetical protein
MPLALALAANRFAPVSFVFWLVDHLDLFDQGAYAPAKQRLNDVGRMPSAGQYDVAGRRPPVRLASRIARIPVKKMPSNVPVAYGSDRRAEPCDLTEIEQVGSNQRAELPAMYASCAVWTRDRSSAVCSCAVSRLRPITTRSPRRVGNQKAQGTSGLPTYFIKWATPKTRARHCKAV